MKGKLHMAKVIVVKNRLTQYHLTALRDVQTEGGGRGTAFYQHASGLSRENLVAAICATVPMRHISVMTPLNVSAPGIVIGKEDCYFVYVRRAGYVMLEQARKILPIARKKSHWGVIDIHRDEKTAEPILGSRHRLANDLTGKTVYLLDPMIATGGSAIEAIRLLKARGARRIVLVGWIAAPEGLRALEDAHPDVDVFVASVDEKLNDIFYIVPGLGDAGDRLYGNDRDEHGRKLVRDPAPRKKNVRRKAKK